MGVSRSFQIPPFICFQAHNHAYRHAPLSRTRACAHTHTHTHTHTNTHTHTHTHTLSHTHIHTHTYICTYTQSGMAKMSEEFKKVGKEIYL